ncbi:hypothetical protein HXX76_001029 [Chlamydomonas incerta]|uniref:Uncharacterized protein n=1 Tax=Chlamydomonas incerta TaxID=51695 RepID=A0A835WBD8_CHLIN|nr:hypothetical protein HXX76_001029 [Chlamydomonas incerta]|eukprot:KAG2444272.1 hypothetical protein HXX76_001029 [Chlamydomonas incerta]
MSLEEEFSDVGDYVQEDDTFDADEGTSEDEVERKIAEEHAKYKEAQAKRQEEVRANRSWSAPPMESPRPEQQKERERERQARASQHDAPDPNPRAEYEPPPRPYLPAQASGGASNLSYLSRPQSAEPRAPSRLSSSGNRGGLGSSHTPASLSGIEEEAGEPSSGGTGASRQASDVGRWPSGTGGSSPDGRGGAIDEGADAEAEASAAPPVDEEESREPMPEPSGGRDEGEESGGRGGEHEAAAAEPSGPEEPEAEEVAEDGGGQSLGGGEGSRGEGSHAALAASFSLRPPPGPSALVEEESSAPPPEEEDSGGRRPSDGHRGHEAASSVGGGSHRTGPPAAAPEPGMAMRGFVEPLEYERSEVQEEASAPAKDQDEEEEEEKEEEEEEEDAYEDDAFEDEGADEEAAEEEEEEDKPVTPPSPAAVASAEPSYSSAPLVAPAAAASAPPAVPPIPKFGAASGQDDEDDDQLFRRAAAAANGRAGSGLAASAAAAQPPPPAPAAPELLPPQQFAMQLLKHDLEVLPQHHRAAADAAAARRRPTSARPAGAGLAAFGYLGYHVADDGLTAPSGPGFRSGSGGSGRAGSPGREGPAGAGALGAGPSLTTIRVPGAEGEGEEGGGAGRPTSAPPMRPEAAEPAAMAASSFIGATRDMRAGRGLPPLSGQAPGGGRPGKAGAGRGSGGGAAGAAGAGAAAAVEGGSPPTEASLSVLDEQEAHAAQNRIKFDVWLDALSGNHQAAAPAKPAAAATPAAGAGDGASSGGGRRLRPMTAPATGRRRPVSARPGAGAGAPLGGTAAGVYGVQPYTVNVPKPIGRPMSAQPHHGRPTSAGRGGAPPPLPSGPVDVPDRAQAAAAADMPVTVQTLPPGALGGAVGGGTAAVEVAGVPVSVYVADTLKRIIEANRWLAALGVSGKRYRLKDRYSNMTVQLIEELAPMQYDAHAQHTYGDEGGHGHHGHGHGHHGHHGHGHAGHSPYGTDGAGASAGAGGGGGGGNVTVLKELTLKQFLSGHSRLKQQAKRLRAAAPQPPLPPQGGGGLGLTDGIGAGPSGARTHRPFSAGPGGPSGGGAGGSRSRPVSAMPYNSGAAGGPAAALYSGGGGSGGGAAAAPRPVRPNSANPAYGRTPQFGGTSPPGAPGGGGAGFAGLASAKRNNGSGGGAGMAPPPLHRTAWGGGGGAGAAAGNGGSGGGAPLPYMVRSVSATTRQPGADADDDEGGLVVEADERGDVSRAVRQQLGGAAEYCQARRAEIARLRNMPFA